MFVVGGESLVDLVAEPVLDGHSMKLAAHAGGSPYNCARAMARLGGDTGYLCPISLDGFGDYLLKPLAGDGVKVLLEPRVNVPTTLAVVTLDARGQAQYEFYRGADRAFLPSDLVAALPDDLSLFQVGGFCPIFADDAKAWLDVVDIAIARHAVISIDPNIRPSLVDDFSAYKDRLFLFFDRAHIIKMSDEDLAVLDPTLSIEAHAAALLARQNCELVVITKGEAGSVAYSQSASGMANIFQPPVFGDTVGAGDSLMAGVLTALSDIYALSVAGLAVLDQSQLEHMLRFGAVVAGLNCGQKGCHPPLRAEVEASLASLL